MSNKQNIRVKDGGALIAIIGDEVFYTLMLH